MSTNSSFASGDKSRKEFYRRTSWDAKNGVGEPPSKMAKISAGDSSSSSLSSSSSSRQERWRTKDAEFHYGNYDRYYGKRAISVGGHKKNTGQDNNWSILEFDDPRLAFFKREWFCGKKILDIGCNVGFLTTDIAKRFEPRIIIGLDIDGKLITRARELLKKRCEKNRSDDGDDDKTTTTTITKTTGGSIDGKQGRCNTKQCFNKREDSQKQRQQESRKDHVQPDKTGLLERVRFEIGNYVLTDESLMDFVHPEYDAILALSLTKWIHLNWGDDGIKRFFRRIYKHLNEDGIFIMETQAWSTYKKKKGLTPEIAHNYDNIRFKPDRFRSYLLSEEVGFASCEVLNQIESEGKGFDRPIYMFRKSTRDATEKSEAAVENNTAEVTVNKIQPAESNGASAAVNMEPEPERNGATEIKMEPEKKGATAVKNEPEPNGSNTIKTESGSEAT